MEKRRIALYVIYDKDGLLDDFRIYYLKELRKVTTKIIAIVSGTLTPESRNELEEIVDEIYVRENKGLLAGAWVDGLNYIGWDNMSQWDEVLMLNDSFFGPFYPLSELMDSAEKSDADFYGAFKNYEEKSYTSIAGRPMKHDHFMGSICYFYIIKERLLHSPEFKRYWNNLPEIKEDWDTYFFAEIDFYQYVLDCGFKIDAYQGDSLKGYFFDNLSHNMYKLVKNDKIPFARIRPFCTDIKNQSSQVHYGKDPRQTLDFIDKETDYDVDMIWKYILRTKNLTDIWNQLQLEYVVPKDTVEKAFIYDKTIAAIVHIYYEDEVETVATYCDNLLEKTDFYITTTSEETKNRIEEEFNKRNLKYVCQIRPNVGVAMSTLWITYADIVTSGKYEYICYIHDKKSPYGQFSIQGQQFAERLYENLVGSKEIVKNIINLFIDNPKLGILGAPMVYHGAYFMAAKRGQAGNYQGVLDLIKLLDLNVSIDVNKVPVSAYGDMFWFRADALRKAINHGFTYDDFNIKYKQDFTILHAIERCYGLIAQDAGYYYAEVINTDEARTDLVNYRYMVEQLCSVLLQKGLYFGCYEDARTVMDALGLVAPVHKNKAKRFLHNMLVSNNALIRNLGFFLQKKYRRYFKKYFEKNS